MVHFLGPGTEEEVYFGTAQLLIACAQAWVSNVDLAYKRCDHSSFDSLLAFNNGAIIPSAYHVKVS